MVDLGARRAAAVLLSGTLLLGGCAARPNMEPGVPLQVRRGHCFFVETLFKQRGVARDRESVLSELTKEPRSAPYVDAGKHYTIGAVLMAVAGGAGNVVGTLGSSGDIEMSREASTLVFVGSLGAVIVAWGFCNAAEGRYAAAAEAYSAPLPPSQSGDDRAHESAEPEPEVRPLPQVDLK